MGFLFIYLFFFEEQIVGFDEIRDVFFFFEIIYVVNGGHCGTQKENI